MTKGDHLAICRGRSVRARRCERAKCCERTPLFDDFSVAIVVPYRSRIFGQWAWRHPHMRFKDDIKPIDRASESLLPLKPITFDHKKRSIRQASDTQFGAGG